MKSTKSLIGSILGGIGILAGFSMLMTGCGDDDKSKDKTSEITQAQLDQCCKTADDYDACVKEYQKNGVCSNDDDGKYVTEYGVPEPTLYGPIPEYGMPDVPIPVEPDDEKIKECCGDDNGSDEYKECVANYQKAGACPPPGDDATPEYGMPDVPLYGMPDDPKPVDPVDEGLTQCCGDNDGSDEYKECVADYKKAGACAHHDEDPMPEYGMPEPVYGMPDNPDEQPDA